MIHYFNNIYEKKLANHRTSFFSTISEDMPSQRSESERMRKAKHRLAKALSKDGHSSIANTAM